MPADSHPGRRLRGERGSSFPAALIATGVLCLLIVQLGNLVALQYARGAVRSALDEGARAGSRNGATTAVCEQRIGDALRDLLGGAMGDGVTIACSATTEQVTATANVHFDGWLGPFLDYDAKLSASAAREDG